ncbi:HAD-IIB family hydrolase [Rhizobium paknamense]|uniref:Mannosylfructose-6-phosphate phosphatase n=1 Tax=Rhizobium paknamense TaxID=1206817 RepID=A0ABU0I9N4_9HYPH|nr:HAD-IIB family hydrolase [Rhizobium paknamense]MDQ0454950.1 mannosylfructose-6-phosphate phosphatase [Rhizobium paknamense]
MERRGLKPIRLFSSDLDGTLAGDTKAARRFAAFWQKIEPENRPLLVYNSGRLVDDVLRFAAEQGLPDADFIIGGVGTMLHGAAEPELADHYHLNIGAGYDVEKINALLAGIEALQYQPERYQHERKSSWYLHEATPEQLLSIENALLDQGLAVKLVYSSKRDLDILPARADKGQALTWLCRQLAVHLDEVVVAGDTGNDLEMFTLSTVRGIVPANGLDELTALAKDNPLIYRARKPEADGVIEGLKHWMAP